MYYEDEIYHSAYSDGYLDGYYAGMELYHADDEMTEEERKARRRKRRRAVALGVAGIAGAGAAGYAIARGLRKKRVPRVKTVTSDYNPNADYSQKVKVERLYHADTEMTEEEKARRRKRRRNIALGVAGVAGAGAAGYAIARGLRKRGRGIVPMGSGSRPTGPRPSGPRLIGGPTGGSSGSAGSSGSRPRGPKPTGPRLTGPTLKRVKVNPYTDIKEPNGWNFKRNRPKYASDHKKEKEYERYNLWMKRAIFDYDPATKKMKRTIYD